MHAAQLAFALLVPWLMLGALTAAGARRRGDGWLRALLTSLLLWPVAWVAWYLMDNAPHLPAAGDRAPAPGRPGAGGCITSTQPDDSPG